MRSKDTLTGGKYIVSCTKMTCWDADAGEEKNILEGKWNIGFSLDYLDISEKIPVEVSGTVFAAKERLENDKLVCDYAEVPVDIYEINLSPPYDSLCPMVCLDETNRQLIKQRSLPKLTESRHGWRFIIHQFMPHG